MTAAAEWRARAIEAERKVAQHEADMDAVNRLAGKVARDAQRMADEERQRRVAVEDELSALQGALATETLDDELLDLHRKAHAGGDEQTAALAGMVLCERAKVATLQEVADGAFDCGFAGWLGEQREVG